MVHSLIVAQVQYIIMIKDLQEQLGHDLKEFV